MKAKWLQEYDVRTDSIYKWPGHESCMTPVARFKDGEYRCVRCKRELELSPGMVRFLEKMNEKKTKTKDCPDCHGKESLTVLYVRNPVTEEWQLAREWCNECGHSIIV